MKVALYARVSTRDRDQNPETQLFALREYADRHEMEIVGEYIDEASAGDFRRRVRWRDLISDVKLRKCEAVLVLRLDRAFRSVKEAVNTLEDFDHHRVAFVSITQDIDTGSPMGKFLLHQLAAFAELEHDLISERVREGMNRAKAEGKHVGRPRKADAR